MKLFIYILISLFSIFLAIQFSFTQAGIFVVGILLGLVFIKFKVGFSTACRYLIVYRYTKGIELFFWIIALSSIIMIPLINYLPNIYSANNGAISIALLVGAFLFGFAQQINDGCVSGSLYKTSIYEGQFITLIFIVLGVWMGIEHYEFWTSNFFYGFWNVSSFITQPILIMATNLLFIICLCFILRLIQSKYLNQEVLNLNKVKSFNQRIFGNISNFQFTIGSIFILHLIYFFLSGDAWSIIRGFNALVGHISLYFDPDDIFFMDFWSGGRESLLEKPLLSDITFISNIGFILGAFLFTLYQNKFNIKTIFNLNIKLLLIKISSGFLLGYGAFIAFGCNIGAFMGGLSTGSLHGWIWLGMVLIGSWFGIKASQILKL